jgi:hypothetical protein
MNSIDERDAILAQIAGSEDEIAALREHVTEVAESQAFKGSDRCGRFLNYIVDQAIRGQFDSLKERVIGTEVFGRSPSYDTSEDAIVRVTASDVRKRLLRYYGRNGTASRFHISLPVGSYVPEISVDAREGARQYDAPAAMQKLQATVTVTGAAHDDSGLDPSAAALRLAGPAAGGATFETDHSKWPKITVILGMVVLLLAALNSVLWMIVWKTVGRDKAVATAAVLPWSVLFKSTRPIHLITSDIDIGKFQQLAGSRISISDYANHNLVPKRTALTSEITRAFLATLQGDAAPVIDTRIAVSVGELAASSANKIDIRGARSLQFSDLKTDDNFIFLGSAYSNPWFSVFNDQLDFRIVPDDKIWGQEFIANVHPGPNEQSVYRPTARGGDTGESYAIVAFVGNPNQYGQVLLLAGLSGEGTQAAGQIATDLPSLSTALRKCGISPNGPVNHFEMLLHVKIMADYPSQYDVVACHILPGPVLTRN